MVVWGIFFIQKYVYFGGEFSCFYFFCFFQLFFYEFVKLFSLMNYLGNNLFNNIEILIKK